MDEYAQLSDVDKHYVSAYGWDAFHKKKFLEKEFQRLNVPQSIPQPQEEEVEETEEEETDEEESEEDDTDPDLKARMFESGIRDQKRRILAKIEAKLDEPEEDPEILKLKDDFIKMLLFFPRFPCVDKAVLTVTRDGNDKIKFAVRVLDKDGKDITFDEKGEVIKVQ